LVFFGRYGVLASNKAINNADLVISMGVGFNRRYTLDVRDFAPNAVKINVNAAVNYSSEYMPDLEIITSTDFFMEELLSKLKDVRGNDTWLAQIKEWKGKEKVLNEK